MLKDFIFFTFAIPFLWMLIFQNKLNNNENGPTNLIAGGTREDHLNSLNAYWAVSIRSRNPLKYFGDNHFCGGTIISHNAVITAAHCVVDKRKVVMRPRRLLVVAGAINRLDISSSTRQLPVKEVNVHPKFLRYTETDIAILLVKTEFPDDEPNIRRLKLSSNPTPYGKEVQIYGWGRIFDRGPYSATIRMARIKLKPIEDCEQIMDTIKPGAICAHDVAEEDLDPCRGDGGGPTVYNNELVAVISWTLGCGTDLLPSLYVDIYSNYEWIQKHISRANPLSSEITITIVLLTFTVIFLH